MPTRIFVVAAGTICLLMVWWIVGPVDPSASAAINRPNATGPVVETSQCNGPDLSLVQIDSGIEMGGIAWWDYAFKNQGSSACTLNGFPRVQLLNARGQVVHSKMVQNEDATPASVTIEPKQQAQFRLRYNNGSRGRKGTHCLASVSRLRIQAPGTTRWFRRNDKIDLCDLVRVSEIYLPPAQ
ncbi:MAG: DUF4232 domain-containing protein [Pyrinomonadaceae bacterium]